MPYVETKLVRDPWDADRRLKEMRLDMTKLLKVRDIARNSSANATPFHPLNAAGTFGYQDGSWAIRNEFVDEVIWMFDRSHKEFLHNHD